MKAFDFKNRILRFPSTPLLVLVVSLATVMGAEALIRTVRQAGYYPVENYATGNKFLEHKIAQLERYIAENGKVEYLLVGNSKLGEAVDCRVVSLKYQEITGEALSCFNFGFAGNTSEFLPVIFRILEEEYSPDKFVFDVFGPYQRNNVQQQNSRWLQYRNGDFNIKGWLIEKSRFIRCFLGVRYWIEQPGEYRQLADAPMKIQEKDIYDLRDEFNYSNAREKEKANIQPKARRLLKARIRRAARVFAAEEIVLPRVIELVGADKLVFITIPVSSRVRDGMLDFQDRSERAVELSHEHGIPLLEMPDPEMLAGKNWKNDGVHMMGSGRWVYSKWLGEALAQQEGFVPESLEHFPEDEKQ